ncbi:MAG: metallophosphoesterase [Bacteroidia bacterium]|nr:metallophosphoesterase [Bacteroidia bacterium]
MNHGITKSSNFYSGSLIFILVSILVNTSCGFSQVISNKQRISFISDIQTPLPTEKIILKPYKNEEARDSLFSDIIFQHPKNIFLLGDLVSRGSNNKAWEPLDAFLNCLNKINSNVYSIPGNHEYMGGPSIGIQIFKDYFPEKWLYGYTVNIDSIAVVMMNSNFNRLSENQLSSQEIWYKSEMNSLDADPAIKAIIVCTHHAPYSNSKIVGSSGPVADLIVPVFEKSQKAILFISGHSHNLEYFCDSIGKHFLIIGGGGGIEQPLVPVNKRIYADLIDQERKPLYFYLVIEKEKNSLKLIARGFKKDFRFYDLDIGKIPFN